MICCLILASMQAALCFATCASSARGKTSGIHSLQAQLIQNGKSSLKMPKPKNVLDRISFGFVGSLMAQGNAKVLEQEDLWGLPEDQCMKATSIQFKNYFEKEQLKYQARVKQRNNSKNILRNVGSKSSLAEISDSPFDYCLSIS